MEPRDHVDGVLVCEKCGEQIDVGTWPFCPHGISACGVISDSIRGGIEIKHGLCNPDGSPKRWYSHTDIKREAKKKGLVNLVEHAPDIGSDKSPWTTKWT